MSGEDRNNANGGFGSSSSTMQFKKFVTEDEIVEKRRIRQEEWEKARKADDPLGRILTMTAFSCSSQM